MIVVQKITVAHGKLFQVALGTKARAPASKLADNFFIFFPFIYKMNNL
jgi:hypothetical protein